MQASLNLNPLPPTPVNIASIISGNSMNGTSCIKFINYKWGTEFRHSTRVIEEKRRTEYFDISAISTNIVILFF